MPGPAARIHLNEEETISNGLEVALFKFRRKGQKKCAITVTFAFDMIAHHVPDSQDPGSDPGNQCDAVYARNDLLIPGTAKISFKPKRGDGISTMTLEADLDTKIPGTGGFLPRKTQKAVPKKKKAATKSKKR
jgi:hypothetical protein